MAVGASEQGSLAVLYVAAKEGSVLKMLQKP